MARAGKLARRPAGWLAGWLADWLAWGASLERAPARTLKRRRNLYATGATYLKLQTGARSAWAKSRHWQWKRRLDLSRAEPYNWLLFLALALSLLAHFGLSLSLAAPWAHFRPCWCVPARSAVSLEAAFGMPVKSRIQIQWSDSLVAHAD